MAEAHVALANEIGEAVTSKGPLVMLERYDDWFAPNFEWHPALLTALDGRVFKGRSGFEEYWDEFLSTFPDVSFTIRSAEAIDDELVLVEASVSGTGTGSGIPIDRDTAYVWEIRDGLTTSGRSFFSRADAEEYLADA